MEPMAAPAGRAVGGGTPRPPALVEAPAANAIGTDSLVADASLDCVVATDQDGRITAFDAAAERTFGHRREAVLGRRLVDVILPPALRDPYADGMARALTTDRAMVLGRRVETTVVRADGSELVVELAIARAGGGGDGGGLPSFVVHMRDVTERRRAEEELRRQATDEHALHARAAALRADVSGALARAVGMREMLQACAEALVAHLDAAFARIWTLRRGGTVLELRASAGLYTRLDGAYARVPVGDLKIGRIATSREPHLTNHVIDDPRVSDKRWARREGMVAFAGYPLVVDERVVGVMAMFARRPLAAEALETLGSIAAAVAQGIERKRSEEELRRSEAYLAEGQRLSHTGSWAWNLATAELFWSREMFRIYGFEPADRAPPYEAVLSRAHPNDAPEVDTALRHAFETGTELRLLTRILVPGEPMKWVETYGHPVRDDAGTLVEFSGTVVDITERVRASRRVRRAIKARYEAVLAERLRIARDMHDGMLQDVAGIALQLRALLPHVRTSPDAAAETLARTLELTERTGREARRVVVGMRAAMESADLVRAVEGAAQRVVRGAIALSVTVTGRARPVTARVCDAAASVVHEAVTNVLKHANARSVHLSLAFGRAKFRLVVRDDGRGRQSPAGDDGAHLGLVGMRERAAELGATLRVQSVAGGGTAVRLDVPYRGP